VFNGRYAKDINFNAFVAAFPMDKPKYIVLSISMLHGRENTEDGRLHPPPRR
jgi:cell division protein FtsI/penicillin-binding protein 2